MKDNNYGIGRDRAACVPVQQQRYLRALARNSRNKHRVDVQTLQQYTKNTASKLGATNEKENTNQAQPDISIPTYINATRVMISHVDHSEQPCEHTTTRTPTVTYAPQTKQMFKKTISTRGNIAGTPQGKNRNKYSRLFYL